MTAPVPSCFVLRPFVLPPSCRASRPSYRSIEAVENNAVAEINFLMKKRLAEFERKAEARIAEALRR